MFWTENLSLLKSQANKKYLDLTCVIFYLSGIKTLINPKDLINDINYSLSCSFRVKIPMQILYLKTLKFLSLLTRLPLKTAFLLQNFKDLNCHMSLIAGSNVLLSLNLMILNEQISVV